MPEELNPNPELDPQPEPAPAPEPDFQKALAKQFASGKTEGERKAYAKFMSTLQELGIEAEDGDPLKALKVFKENASQKSTAVKTLEETYQRSLNETKAQLTQYQEQLKAAEVNHQLDWSITKFPVHDVSAVRLLLQQNYKVKSTEDGVRVYNADGTIVYDKSTAEPASIDSVVKQFLDERQFLLKPNSKGGAGSTDLKGSPTDYMKAYAAMSFEERIKPENIAKLKALTQR